MTTAARCTRCGESLSPADRFCARCGADVSRMQGGVATELARSHPDQPPLQHAALLDALRQATLGEYEVLAELGRGGMATVYLAHEIALDRKVAIKVMSPALLAGEGMIERFKREARTAASLSHPNIIPIYAVNEGEHLLYFVMKFVEGRPLDSIIKEAGALPIPMVQAIVNQVGAALGYAHKRGIVHRDVKPPNIMVDAEGWAVVTDFGIAKVAQAQGLTMTGATVGTPSYMSPEQGAAKPLTGASDQYSLGVVAYEMLAGRLPFVADSVMAIMYAHFNEPPPPVTDVRPETPPELAAAVMRMLEKEPERRWPTMEAAVAAVGGVPLAHDDPIRTQLVMLAAAGASAQLLKRISTPASPMPGGRSQAGKTTNIAALTISPAQVTIAVGGAVQLTATAKRVSGTTQPGRGITWASTNTEVVTVSPTGLATAVGAGTATVTAAQENTSATATINVTGAEARRRRLWPELAVLALVGAAGAVWWLKPWAATGRPESISTSPQPAAEAVQPAPPPAAAVESTPAPPPPKRKPAPRAAPKPSPTPEQPPVATPTPPAAHPTVKTPPPAERRDTVAAQPQGPVTPPAPAAAAESAPAPAPAAAAPVDPRPQIEAAIASYAQAIQARDINGVKRVAPGLGADVLQNLRDFFQAVRDLRVTLQVRHVGVSGPTAAVDVSGTYNFVQNGKSVSQLVSFRATLEHGADGWHITAIAPLQ